MGFEVMQDRALFRRDKRSHRYVAIRVQAPAAPDDQESPPQRLSFVIDRSGSMSGRKLRLACEAVSEALTLLRPKDRFAVLTYSEDVEVLVPSSEATADAVDDARRRLATVSARGCTNLSDGWLVGCDQHEAVDGDLGVRTLLLSDGRANRGIVDPSELAEHARALRQRGVVTTTFGLGRGFDEMLLDGMARAGGGAFYFIEDAAQIQDFFGSELGEALQVVAPDTRLRVQAPSGVWVTALGGQEPRVDPASGALEFRLGDLASRQQLDVVLRLSFKAPKADAQASLDITLSDAQGVFTDSPPAQVTFSAADRDANRAQQRNREVDRAVALQYAAQARYDAGALNRRGDYVAAAECLERVARRIGPYAGDDLELLSLVESLRRDAVDYGRRMGELDRKRRHFGASSSLRSRDARGRARRPRPPEASP